MFAMTCSNPTATKNQIGRKMMTILETISLALADIHTAIQTSQLQLNND